MLAHEKRKRAIGTSMVTHAHMLGSRSSGGPVIRCPQQQKVLRAGHTMYERSMVFGCGGVAALLAALSARARSTKPAEGGGVQGGAFGLMDRFGVLGIPPPCRRATGKPRRKHPQGEDRYTGFGKQSGSSFEVNERDGLSLSPRSEVPPPSGRTRSELRVRLASRTDRPLTTTNEVWGI